MALTRLFAAAAIAAFSIAVAGCNQPSLESATTTDPSETIPMYDASSASGTAPTTDAGAAETHDDSGFDAVAPGTTADPGPSRGQVEPIRDPSRT